MLKFIGHVGCVFGSCCISGYFPALYTLHLSHHDYQNTLSSTVDPKKKSLLLGFISNLMMK